VIEADGLTEDYGAKRAVDGLTLTIAVAVAAIMLVRRDA
jgi:hypothetical protein